MTSATNRSDGRRILIVDDNPAIHDDFRKVLAAPAAPTGELEDLEAQMFGASEAQPTGQREFELVSAYQGRDALGLVTEARAQGRPFSLAFVDMRMPPGWDGLETIEQLWRVDPSLQVVICSAYSDHSWSEMCERLGDRDALLILKKPFDTIEIVQLAHALTAKWALEAERRVHLDELEQAVRARTAELEAVNARLSEELVHRDRMEAELRIAQRMEAIGHLAAGVAHEINTPLQYVSDNLVFVRDSVTTLLGLGVDLRALVQTPEVRAEADRLAEAADLDYLVAQIPGALDESDRGLGRISKIVRAMRELVHPGSREVVATDLNQCLQNALDVTGGVYKLVAVVETSFGPLPPVMCYPQEINQVFLNLIVNAAHAVEDAGRRGVIGVKTRVDGDSVVIEISDTGCGIPEAHRDRIFDPFYTTKAVGRGTGQGLTISRSIIVDHHGGALTFDTAVGTGTTFRLRLPIRRGASIGKAA
ncbi:MAG TPA: ATP-binding protein [Kofleriaceae bacterium]